MTAYGGGGGAGCYTGPASGNAGALGAPGGIGGGGAGGANPKSPTENNYKAAPAAVGNGSEGTVNRGGGGGGGTSSHSAAARGGAGGSGIVILRYETNQAKTSEKSNVFSAATGGTKTTDNAYAVHTFTSSGTFTTTTKVQEAEV